MEQAGSLFFASFIDLVRQFALPIAACFILYLGLELKRIRPAERLYAFLMFSYFFLIIAAYWLIKPIKKALLVGYYQTSGWTVWGHTFNAAQAELVAKEINLFLAILAAWGFMRLASFVKREKLVLSLIGFFSAGFLAFALLFRNPDVLTRWMFYFYGDFFATLMIAGFFAFLNDSCSTEKASRLYGLIGLGGVLGGFFGSAVLSLHVKQLGHSNVALVAIGALVIMAVLAVLAGKRVQPTVLAMASNVKPALPSGVGFFFKSPYLLGIAALVGLYEMVSTLMDYQFTSAIVHFVPGDQLGEHFANVFSFTNLMAILVQLFATRVILTRLGVTPALLFLPLTAFTGEIGFVLLPGLLLGSLLNTFDNAFAYSLNQSAKEALYVPMEQEVKYRGKAVIDVFILRGAKAVSAILALLLTMFFVEFNKIRWLSSIVLGLLCLWFLVIRFIRPLYAHLCARSIETPISTPPPRMGVPAGKIR